MKKPKAGNRESRRTHQKGASEDAGETRPRGTAKAAREARSVRRGEPVSPGVGSAKN